MESGYYHFVNFPIRGVDVLDVIVSDDPLIVNSVSAAPPLGHSDHLTVEF